MNGNEVTQWIGKFKLLCKVYDDRGIFNADENGFFDCIPREKTLCFTGEKCSTKNFHKNI